MCIRDSTHTHARVFSIRLFYDVHMFTTNVLKFKSSVFHCNWFEEFVLKRLYSKRWLLIALQIKTVRYVNYYNYYYKKNIPLHMVSNNSVSAFLKANEQFPPWTSVYCLSLIHI